MRLRLFVPVAALAITALVACGGDEDPNVENARDFGPQGTFTADDSGCSVSTNGFVAEAGTVLIRFQNEYEAAVSIELISSDGATVASADDLAPGDELIEEFDLEAGEYTTSCSDGTLTWTNEGEGETPSGVVTGSPAFTVSE